MRRIQLGGVVGGLGLLCGCPGDPATTDASTAVTVAMTGTEATASTGAPVPTTGATGTMTTQPTTEATEATEVTGATDTATTTEGVTITATTSDTTTDPATTTGETTEASDTTTASTGDTTDSTGGDSTGMMVDCSDEPPVPAGDEVQLAPEFAESYKTYELGPVPGIPNGSRLGGCVISADDPNLLLVAGDSEAVTGKIYAIKVVRGNCDHIVGYDGTAEVVANTPYIDANLVLVKSGLLFYTEWPVNRISQLLPGQMAPALTTDLGPLGVESSVSGLGIVPDGFGDAGAFRILTWSGGRWYHLQRTPNGELFTLSDPMLTATLPNGPGGFAYVPEGSPGFATDHIIVSEWSVNKVGVYEADAVGDPKVATRKEFFTTFPRPWGAYFEPLTGDFMFLTWGIGTDKIYIVQGFKPPPPVPQ